MFKFIKKLLTFNIIIVSYTICCDLEPLNINELKQVKRYASFLEEKTTQDDLVIFLGRSPWIFKKAWDFLQVERNYLSLSYSDKAYQHTSWQKIEPNQNQLKAYREYLNSEGIAYNINQMINKSKGSIVLVDYTVSGDGIGSFAKLLTNIYPSIENLRINFAYFYTRFSYKYFEEFREHNVSVENNILDYVSRTDQLIKFIPYSIYEDPSNHCLMSKLSAWDFNDSEVCHYDMSKWTDKTYHPSEQLRSQATLLALENFKKDLLKL